MAAEVMESGVSMGGPEASTVLWLEELQCTNRIEVIGIREGELVDCMVCADLIDHEEVPVKEIWAESLLHKCCLFLNKMVVPAS